MSNLKRRLQQVITLPPQVVFRKLTRKVNHRIRQDFGRWRTRWSDTRIGDSEFSRALVPTMSSSKLLQTFDTRTKPCFFLNHTQRTQTTQLYQQFCPGAISHTIARADQICEHIWDLLGSGPIFLSEKIDWHNDFIGNHRWDPKCYYADVERAHYPGGYDIKVPWELSRCQHFAWLGQAYWLTENEKYSQEFVAQVSDWIHQNPPQLGVNWTCTMDVAIRTVNWLWGYYFFHPSPFLTNNFKIAFFKSLLAHGRHIIQNLEWSETLTSNHYLSNIVGLVYLGILLPEFKEAQRWREFGLQELEKEMFKQVYADGMDFEASTSYHRLVTELFLSATVLASHNGHHFSVGYMERLEKMLEFIIHVTKPDGTTPLIGDSDNGRLHRLKVWPDSICEWNDFRYLLAIGAPLFQRDDFALAAGDQWEEAIWIWGKQAIEYQQQVVDSNCKMRTMTSRSFVDCGLYIMRHQHHYALINAGPNGQNDNGGHAHNDKLSFELFTQGCTWLVDPGAYLYTADYELRNLFRSTHYHNTIEVAGQEQNRFATDKEFIFQLQNDADTVVHCWQTTEVYDLFIGEHRGYMRLPNPTLHRRVIFFDKSLLVWIVQDRLSAPQPPTGSIYFHFAPNLQIKPFHSPYTGVYATSDNNKVLNLFTFNEMSEEPQIEKGWVSSGYGLRTKANIVGWRWPIGATQFTVVVSNGNTDMAYRNVQIAMKHFEAILEEAEC